MADLGTIPAVYDVPPRNPELFLITHYRINRGLKLGPIVLTGTRNAMRPMPILHEPVTNYLVRQLRILYRQLWPARGQRFPQ